MKKIPFSEVKIGEEFVGCYTGTKYKKVSDDHATYDQFLKFSKDDFVKVDRPVTFGELSPGDIFTIGNYEFQKLADKHSPNAIWTGHEKNTHKWTGCGFASYDVVIQKESK